MKRLAVVIVLLPFLLACEQKLPGPLACEQMAYRVLGRDKRDAQYSPKVRRITDRLVQGCLTVPFDPSTIVCAESGRDFLGCMDELARRVPERKEALSVLLRDLKTLGRF